MISFTSPFDSSGPSEDVGNYYHAPADRPSAEVEEQERTSHTSPSSLFDYVTTSQDDAREETSYTASHNTSSNGVRATAAPTYLEAMVGLGVLPDDFTNGYVSLDKVAMDNPYAGRGMVQMETILKVMELSGEAHQMEDGCYCLG